MKNYEEVASDVFRRRNEYEAAKKLKKQTKHRRRTVMLTAFVIALVIGVVGTAGAVLSEKNWFADAFAKNFGGALSEKQLQIVERATTQLHQSATSDSITMTVESVIADKNMIHVCLDVSAPEEMVLDLVNLGCHHYHQMITVESADGEDLRATAIFEDADDEDGLRNTRTYYFLLYIFYNDGTPYLFTEESSITMQIHGLDRAGIECVSDGQWSFEMTFDSVLEKGLDIVSEPVICGQIEIQSFCLYEMSASGCYVSMPKKEEERIFLGPVQVVMKDGSVIRDKSRWSGDGEFSVIFRAPIVLENVDYILIGGYENLDGNWVGATKIPVS